MKIALIQCPMFSVRMPQLGPAYLKSKLKAHGHEVQQFDFNISLYASVGQEHQKYWNYDYETQWCADAYGDLLCHAQCFRENLFVSGALLERWANDVIKSGPDLIGFTVYYTSLSLSLLLANKIKEMDARKKIIFGGPAIACFLEIFKNDIVNVGVPIRNALKVADMVAVGEAEETLVEVAGRLENKSSLLGCLGTIINEQGSLVVNKLRPLVADLDSLPFPEFSAVDSPAFTDKHFLPILATRGCPHQCTFCDFPYLDRYRLRMRSARNVVDEIRFQIERYGGEFFHFNDATVNADLGFLSRLCDLLVEEKVPIRWGASVAIDRLMRRGLLDKMKQAGCEYVAFGIESGSDKVLRDMRKGHTAADARQNIIDCHEAGISACTNWMVGYCSEDEDDFQQSLRFISENMRYISELDVAVFTVKPHTYLYENAEALGIVIDKGLNWHTIDGKNEYHHRLDRLSRFRELQNQMGKLNERIGGLR